MNKGIKDWLFYGGFFVGFGLLWYSGYYEKHPGRQIEFYIVLFVFSIFLFSRLYLAFFVEEATSDKIQEISSKVNNGGWSPRIGGFKTFVFFVILVVGFWVVVGLRLLLK